MSDEDIKKDAPAQKKKCFIITPIGDDNSEIRRLADGVIEACIKPVLEELNFECENPRELVGAGSITKDVIGKIVNDDLVIANLTKLNPNVMYELGIRHSARKPVVHICEKGTVLPFDIAPERTLLYVNDMKGAEELKPKLKEFINAALDGSEVNNPVYDAIQRESIMAQLKTTDPMKYIINQLKYITTSLNFSKNVVNNVSGSFQFDLNFKDDRILSNTHITDDYLNYLTDYLSLKNIPLYTATCNIKNGKTLQMDVNIDQFIDSAYFFELIDKFKEQYHLE